MDARPKRYDKNEQITWFRKRSGASLFAYFLCWQRESKVAARAKHQVTIINKTTTSADEP